MSVRCMCIAILVSLLVGAAVAVAVAITLYFTVLKSDDKVAPTNFTVDFQSMPQPEHTDMVFTCAASSKPWANVRWTLGGVDVTANATETHHPVANDNLDYVHSVLTFKGTRDMNGRVLRCLLVWEHKQVFEEDLELEILWPLTVDVKVAAVITEGQPINITCDARGGNPPKVDNYHWEFYPKYPELEFEFVCHQRECVIQNAVKNHSGIYNCTVANWGGYYETWNTASTTIVEPSTSSLAGWQIALIGTGCIAAAVIMLIVLIGAACHHYRHRGACWDKFTGTDWVVHQPSVEINKRSPAEADTNSDKHAPCRVVYLNERTPIGLLLVHQPSGGQCTSIQDHGLEEVIKNIVHETWHPDEVGRGNDDKGRRHRTLRIKCIKRVQNAVVRSEYQNRCNGLLQTCETSEKEISRISKEVKTRGFLQLDRLLKNKVNEVFLFHGTGNVENIINQGFDPRVGGRRGLFGQGVYFAETSTKADQYAGDGGHHYMFLARVLLGNPYICNSGARSMTRPPCVICQQPGTTCAHPKLYDSVIGTSFGGVSPLRFREFIVYEKSLCYPEFLITYERD